LIISKQRRKHARLTPLSFSGRRMLQTVSELRDHKRKELDLQRLLNLVKKRLYVVAEKKEKLETSSTNFLLRISKL